MNIRPERLSFFLVVWFTMFSSTNVLGQITAESHTGHAFAVIPLPGTAVGSKAPDPASFQKMEAKNAMMADFLLPTQRGFKETSIPPKVGYIQPADLYYSQSGFFCKREWEIEKTTHIPFRFRLGSLADCNAIEGKR